DEIIDWSRTPEQIHNQVRSIGGRTKINGMDVKIISTHLENEKLIIDSVQPAGKKPMAWHDFVNGLRGATIEFTNHQQPTTNNYAI
ncbi:MAG: hypothetical protein LBR41_01590, partial [Rickettsiales bacterium]|nr:hypothetical protein [Rickettsiales bacterium]